LPGRIRVFTPVSAAGPGGRRELPFLSICGTRLGASIVEASIQISGVAHRIDRGLNHIHLSAFAH
jgi:hypothetical protein